MERWQFPLLLNLNPFRNEISKGVSVFTAVKNRKETLIESLKTWVAHDQIDEIIIVDWSSDDSLIPYIQQFQNGKILLAIIRNQPKWILSHAYNLAARLTTKSKILKMDADVKILPGFFQQHNLESGIFFTGNWESARDENDKHLNGICYMFRDDFFSVNGYNEFIKSYGWDDIDLYDRLKAKSLIRKDLTHNTLLHIPHANRTNFQSQMSFLNTANDMEKSLLNSLVNKFISSSYKKWSLEENPLSFSIKFQDQFTIFCDQEGEDNNIVPPDIISQCESMAIIERFYELGAGLSRELLSELNREELITLLNLHYTRQHLSESGSLFDIIYKINRKYLVANDDKDIEINKLKDENCLKEELLDTRKQIIKHKNLLINSLNFRLDEYKNSLVRSQNKIIALKSSYSWKTGHAMMSGIAFTQSLLKNLGTNVQIFRNKTSEIKEKSLSTSDNHDFLTQKQYLPKVNLGDQVGAYYGTHRSGWRFAVSALAELHKPDGVFLDTFIERTFIWHPDGIRPHQKPWIGFIHVPPFVPTWHDYTVSNDSIFTIPEWIKSFKYCRGLYTLSRYHKRLLESQLHNIPINSLFHPTEEPIVKWKWDHFQRNSEKKVIQVGSWLRKLYSIHLLKAGLFQKVFLRKEGSNIDHLLAEEKKYCEFSDQITEDIINSVISIDFQPDKEYDELLAENIVFLDLYDASANNTIVECMVRDTPILVNPLEAVVEYLGPDYPFYFNDLDEASRKLNDMDLVKKTHCYLLDHPLKKNLTPDYFRQSFVESPIYQSL